MLVTSRRGGGGICKELTLTLNGCIHRSFVIVSWAQVPHSSQGNAVRKNLIFYREPLPIFGGWEYLGAIFLDQVITHEWPLRIRGILKITRGYAATKHSKQHFGSLSIKSMHVALWQTKWYSGQDADSTDDNDENGEKGRCLKTYVSWQVHRGCSTHGSVTKKRAVADLYTDDIAFSVVTPLPQRCTRRRSSIAPTTYPSRWKSGNPDTWDKCALVQAVHSAHQ